jgi:hypothetical protein
LGRPGIGEELRKSSLSSATRRKQNKKKKRKEKKRKEKKRKEKKRKEKKSHESTNVISFSPRATELGKRTRHFTGDTISEGEALLRRHLYPQSLLLLVAIRHSRNRERGGLINA